MRAAGGRTAAARTRARAEMRGPPALQTSDRGARRPARQPPRLSWISGRAFSWAAVRRLAQARLSRRAQARLSRRAQARRGLAVRTREPPVRRFRTPPAEPRRRPQPVALAEQPRRLRPVAPTGRADRAE